MRILHTADWHLGRTLYGVDRTPEIADALTALSDYVLRDEVDLVLVAGDLFDNPNPGAEAEAAAYRFFAGLHSAGIPSVVIAGNHDSPARLDALKPLLYRSGAVVLGYPQTAAHGGIHSIVGHDDGPIRLALLPWVSQRRLVRTIQLMDGEDGVAHFQDGMTKLIHHLTQGFRPTGINLLVGHLTMEGIRLAHSESPFHCSQAYTVPVEALRQIEDVGYIALGHIHHRQEVAGRAHAMYSGSLIQLGFGEDFEAQGALILDVKAGEPATLRRIITAEDLGARRLTHVKLRGDELGQAQEAIDSGAWVKLTLTLDAPRPGLKERLMASHPNVIAVELLLPDQVESEGAELERIDLSGSYASYLAEQRPEADSKALTDAFDRLTEEVQHEAA